MANGAGSAFAAEHQLDQNAKEVCGAFSSSQPGNVGVPEAEIPCSRFSFLNSQAEARLAARRKARAEGRAARMKVVESVDEDGRPRNRDVRAASIASVSSRRSSDADSEFGEYR